MHLRSGNDAVERLRRMSHINSDGSRFFSDSEEFDPSLPPHTERHDDAAQILAGFRQSVFDYAGLACAGSP